MATRKLKDMWELAQNLLPGLCSLVITSCTPAVEQQYNLNMCVQDSLEEKIEQCRVEVHSEKKMTKQEKKKEQMRLLHYLVEKESMIVPAEILEAVIQVESGGNVEIGSRGNGCGVMQLTLPAIAGGLSRLYSPTSRHDKFREKYAGALDAKKSLINGVTDNYFAIIEYGAKMAAARIEAIKVEYAHLQRQKELFVGDLEIEREVKLRIKTLNEEQKVLRQFASAVKHGYLLFDAGAKKVYNKQVAFLEHVPNADTYIQNASGFNLPWVSYVARQRQMIADVRRKTCDRANTELNIVFGDLTLTIEADYFRNKSRQGKTKLPDALERALYSYNQGRTDYLTQGVANGGAYYNRFVGAYYSLFDEKPPRVALLQESPRIM